MTPARPLRPLRADVAVPAVMVLAFGVLYAVLAPHGLILNDEGWYLYPALRMLEGDVLYRDVFTYYAPLRYHGIEALFALTGPSVLVARLAWACVLLGTLVATYRLARRFVGPAAAWLPVCAYGLAPGPWYKGLNALCTTLFLLAIARVFERPSAPRLLLLGGIAGASLIAQQEVGFVQIALATTGVVFARSVRAGGLPGRAALVDFACVLAGVTAGAAPMFAWYAWIGALPDLLDAVFLQAAEYSRYASPGLVALVSPSTLGTAAEGRAVGMLMLLPLAGYAVAGALLLREVLARRFSSETLLAGAVLLHAVPALAQGYNPPLLARVLQTAVPFYLAITWVSSRLPARAARTVAVAAAVALVAALALIGASFPRLHPSGAYSGTAWMLRYQTPVRLLGDEIRTTQALASEIGLVRGFIDERTATDAPVFAAPLHSMYNVLLERPNPTRFLGDIGTRAMSASRQRVEAERLLGSSTRYAIVDRSWWRQYSVDDKPILAALVEHFCPIRSYGSVLILEREPRPERRRFAAAYRRFLVQPLPDDATPQLRGFVRDAPDEPLPHMLLATHLARAGHVEAAQRHFRAAHQLDPSDAIARAFAEADAATIAKLRAR